MNNRLVFDRSYVTHPSPEKSLLSDRTLHVTARRFTCTRVGVIDPPPSPLAMALVSALRKVGHRLAGFLTGVPKGGAQ
jgi:hypothetical protein